MTDNRKLIAALKKAAAELDTDLQGLHVICLLHDAAQEIDRLNDHISRLQAEIAEN